MLRTQDPFHSQYLAGPRPAPPTAADGGPTFSDAELTVTLTGQTPQLPVPRGGPRRPSGPPILRASSGEVRPLTRPTRIGSGPENDWVLKDPYISRHHVFLSPDGDIIRVSDRGSRNGTLIGGVRVQQGELRLGNCLVLGRTTIRYSSQHTTNELRGVSPAMAKVRDEIQRFAPTDLPVLVLGESGTGKELVARALHEASGRRGELVAINCGALPKELIESELFGHERGAFTGAQKRHLGCFGEADGGTLFLDEIAELPLELQPRLLRAIEARAIRPVGQSRELSVDVRVVAATHCNLLKAVSEGRFRKDLYYRLCGLELVLQPLRARKADIPDLVRHFLEDARLPPCSISDEELARVAEYPWPGNARQLRHAVARAAHLFGPVLVGADIIGPSQLQGAVLPPGAAELPILGRTFAEIERDIYVYALSQTGGNRRAAAELLAVPKSTLHDKLRRLGIAAQEGVVA